MTTRVRLAVANAADLLATVPYLLGFHPADSLVAVGVRGTALTFIARVDLPPAGEAPDALAEYFADLVSRQAVDGAMLVGYGPADRVERALFALHRALEPPVHLMVRLTGGRYWSYGDPSGGGDPAGVPFDPATRAVAAAAAFAGAVALPDRQALVARIAPVAGPARTAMRAATAAAERRLDGLRGGALAIRRAGRQAVREAITRHRAGGVLTDDEVAWLSVLLPTIAVRDLAWESVTDPELHTALWTDVVRRVEPHLVAAPASLLSFAAWRTGDGSLASVAAARARDADPAYSMAVLMEDILARGVAPSTLDGWPRRERSGRVPRGRWRRADPGPPGHGRGRWLIAAVRARADWVGRWIRAACGAGAADRAVDSGC